MVTRILHALARAFEDGKRIRQRGRTLDAMAYLVDLWREYPNTPSIESDFFGLSQVLAGAAGRATTDPARPSSASFPREEHSTPPGDTTWMTPI